MIRQCSKNCSPINSWSGENWLQSCSSLKWWTVVLNKICFLDWDPTAFCNLEPNQDWSGFRKNYRIRYGYPNCVDHCSL